MCIDPFWGGVVFTVLAIIVLAIVGLIIGAVIYNRKQRELKEKAQ